MIDKFIIDAKGGVFVMEDDRAPFKEAARFIRRAGKAADFGTFPHLVPANLNAKMQGALAPSSIFAVLFSALQFGSAGFTARAAMSRAATGWRMRG